MKFFTVVLCIGLAQGMSLVATAEESQGQQSLTEPGVFEMAEETLSDLNIISDQIPVQKMLNDTGEFERLCDCKDRFKKVNGNGDEVVEGSITGWYEVGHRFEDGYRTYRGKKGLTEAIASACYTKPTGWSICRNTCIVCYDGKKSICSSHCNRNNGVSVFRSAKENSVKRLLDADGLPRKIRNQSEYEGWKKVEEKAAKAGAEAAEESRKFWKAVEAGREAGRQSRKVEAARIAKIENEEFKKLRTLGNALPPIEEDEDEVLLFDEADAEEAAAKVAAAEANKENSREELVGEWIAFANAADPKDWSEYIKVSSALLETLKELRYYGIITETRFTELQGRNDLHENTKMAEAAQAAEAVEAAKDPRRKGPKQSIAGTKTQNLINKIRELGPSIRKLGP